MQAAPARRTDVAMQRHADRRERERGVVEVRERAAPPFLAHQRSLERKCTAARYGGDQRRARRRDTVPADPLLQLYSQLAEPPSCARLEAVPDYRARVKRERRAP